MSNQPAAQRCRLCGRSLRAPCPPHGCPMLREPRPITGGAEDAASGQGARPHRAYEVNVNVGADTWEDALAALEHAMFELQQHGPECKSVMGGPSSGHIITVKHDPEMTHDRYVNAVSTYHRGSITGAQDSPQDAEAKR